MADEKFLFNKMTKEFIYYEHLFEVAENDVTGEFNWNMAIVIARNVGNGWRLPTLTEMDTMVKHKDLLKMNHKSYWTAVEDGEKALAANMKWYLLSQYALKESKKAVRLVKSR